MMYAIVSLMGGTTLHLEQAIMISLLIVLLGASGICWLGFSIILWFWDDEKIVAVGAMIFAITNFIASVLLF